MTQKEAEKKNLEKFCGSFWWLVWIAGFEKSKHPLYILYIIWLFVVLFYVLVMAIYASCLVVPDKILTVSCIHVAMIATFVIFVLSSRVFTYRSINETNIIINSGIFTYEDEEVDEKHLEVKKKMHRDIKKISHIFSILFFAGGLSNLTIFPLTQLLFRTEEDDGSIFNPYLPPYFLYMPFDTRTFKGYCLGYLVDVILVITLYGITICWMDFYIHCILQLRAQLQILIISLQSIQRRAYTKYKENGGSESKNQSTELLYKEEFFQKCLYSCFRSNIQHHQALLRLKKALQPMHGAGMLDIYLMAALIYAAVLYLIVQDLPANYLVNLVVMLVAEQSNLLLMCVLGEGVSEESERLFEALYDIPWIDCNKSFNRAVDIMMCYVRVPLKIKAIIIGSPADIEAYGELMSVMYKTMNLVRQSDVSS